MELDSHALWSAKTFVPHVSRRSAEMVAERCRLELNKAEITHNIKTSAIGKAKLAAELKAREFARGTPYTQEEEIQAEVIGLAKVRVDLYLPEDKEKVRNIITETFHLRADTEGKPDGTDLCTEYYWVSFEEQREEEEQAPTRLVGIKVVTDKGDREFEAPHEVAAFLQKMAASKGRIENDCGDARLLWEVLQILGLNRHRQLRDIMLQLDLSKGLASDFSRMADGFAPLELSLATYVTDSIIRLPCGKDKIIRTAESAGRAVGSNRERYRMRVLRDTFLWLAHVYPWGEGTGSMIFHGLDKPMANRQRNRIRWLDTLAAMRFYDAELNVLPDAEGKELANLWAMFEGHTQLPAQYAFNLAQLGVRSSTPPNWAHFQRAITGLVYDRPTHSDRKNGG